MNEPDLARWLEPKHWGDLLRHHLNPETDYGIAVDEPHDFGWQCRKQFRLPWSHDRIGDVKDGSLAAIWLGDVSPQLGDIIQQWWPKLKEGGYIGGPSCGWGFLPGNRWATNTKRSVFDAHVRIKDTSSLFRGNQANPCWFMFKCNDKPTLLLLSGADRNHTEAFGDVSQANHKDYCEKWNYDYKWLVWDDCFPEFENRSPVWGKMWAVERALSSGDFDQVWWIDGDAVFLRHDLMLQGFLHPKWNSVHPEFQDGRTMLSSGVWGAHRGEVLGLQDVWNRDTHGFGFYSEELNLSDSAHEKPELWTQTQLVDHRLFNSLMPRDVHYHDPDRNFIVHFAGVKNETRRSCIKDINLSLSIR